MCQEQPFGNARFMFAMLVRWVHGGLHAARCARRSLAMTPIRICTYSVVAIVGGAGRYEKLEQIERASEVGSDEEPAEGATCEAKPPVAPGAPPIPLRDDRIVWSKRERLLQPAPEVSISRVIG